MAALAPAQSVILSSGVVRWLRPQALEIGPDESWYGPYA